MEMMLVQCQNWVGHKPLIKDESGVYWMQLQTLTEGEAYC
jgi:hypothetical protein